jgi:hypothetical protein
MWAPPDGSQDPRLVVTSNAGRVGDYVTLSYRWGEGVTFTTTKENLQERMAAILLDNMPATIRDAVIVTQRLGFRFLWIDALCIIQNSPTDWAEQSALMAEVYRNATLNIAVDLADDSSGGFLKKRNILQVRSCRHPSLLGPSGGQAVICPYMKSEEDEIAEGSITGRGWVLQERAFSKRILHWTAKEVAWECTMLEATERKPAYWDWTLADATLWTDLRNLLREPRWLDAKLPLPWMYNSIERYNVWYEALHQYSWRRLTKGSDKFPAISGLAKIFHEIIEERPTYIAGLWKEDLFVGLTWISNFDGDPLEAFGHPVEIELSSSSESRGRMKGLPAYRAPSFSWASTDSQVTVTDAERRDWPLLREARILSSDVEVKGPNPFGSVVNGHVKLQGLALEYNKISWMEVDGKPEKVSDLDGRIWPDHVDDWNDRSILGPGMVLFCLRLRKGTNNEDRANIFCLILYPTGVAEGEFYRVGVYDHSEFSGDFSHWREMRVTIV